MYFTLLVVMTCFCLEHTQQETYTNRNVSISESQEINQVIEFDYIPFFVWLVNDCKYPL